MTSSETTNALSRQVGEDAYTSPWRDFEIQPVEFIQRNKIGWCEANVIKYVCRWKNKNGIQDLEKAKHYIDLLIELEKRYCTNDEGVEEFFRQGPKTDTAKQSFRI